MKVLFVALIICTFVLSGQTCSSYWTNWLDRDNPSGTGDWERYKGFAVRDGQPPCKDGYEPVDADCRVKSTKQAWYEANEKILECNRCTAEGFVCKNKDQTDSSCEDYEIRFLCYKQNDTK